MKITIDIPDDDFKSLKEAAKFHNDVLEEDITIEEYLVKVLKDSWM